jgi:phosphosulfolactate phosphohydrolase-like enzyme
VEKITVVTAGWTKGLRIPQNYDLVIDVSCIEYIAPAHLTAGAKSIISMKSGAQFYSAEEIPELMTLLGFQCL